MPIRRLLAATACGLALATAAFGPASAQTAAPAPAPSGADAPSAGSSMPIMAILPPRRPAGLKPAEETAAGSEAAAAQAPQAQPPQVQAAASSGPAPTPVAQPAGAPMPLQKAAPNPAAEPLSDKAVIERANAYFNGINGLVGDFVQIGGDGRRLGGKIYLAKPGRLRFEYDAPSTLEVIADGQSVAVRDRKLATQDLYPIGQTPLKFLVRERIDLARDTKVVGVSADQEEVRLALQDSSTLGGTSKITLTFDPAVQTLTRWQIVDPQGFSTTVQLSNLDKSRRVDRSLFVINYARELGSQSGQ
jgi:outer membrane lipoprotein-sorting protein